MSEHRTRTSAWVKKKNYFLQNNELGRHIAPRPTRTHFDELRRKRKCSCQPLREHTVPVTTANHTTPAASKTRIARAATAALDATTKGNNKAIRGAIPQPLEAASLPDALLKIQTVTTVTALSASSIFRKTAAGEFPEPIRLGKRCTRWRAVDVRAWLAAQVAG